MSEPVAVVVSKELYYHEVAYVRGLEARVAKLEAALLDCKRYAEVIDDEWVPHHVDDALSETGES